MLQSIHKLRTNLMSFANKFSTQVTKEEAEAGLCLVALLYMFSTLISLFI